MRCTFLAELVEVWFPSQLGTDDERKAWLQDKLWLQRKVYQERAPKPGFETSEGQFKAREVDYFTEFGETHYIIRNLRRIEPLPLPKLKKVDGNHELSPNYIRSYSICWFPESDIHEICSSSMG